MASSAVLSRLPGLRHFVEVAQRGSFAAAAEKLNVAPSAVSKQVKNLEESLGVELFLRERGRGGLELTEAGSILLYRCASVINELTVAREELAELRGLQRGHLRLGVNEVVATDLLPGILNDLHRNHPNLQFTIVVENTPEMVRRMQDGDIDVMLGYSIPPSPDLEVLATMHRKTYLITALSHPLASRRSIRFEDIAGEKLILPDASLALHHVLQDLLTRTGISVRPVMTTNSFALLRQMVQDGLGVSFVIGRFLLTKRERLAFIDVEGQRFEKKPLSCCRIAGRTPTMSSVAFAAAIKTLFAQYGG